MSLDTVETTTYIRAMKHQQWEHQSWFTNEDGLDGEINVEGDNGWELVQVIKDTTKEPHYMVIMKRPLVVKPNYEAGW